MGFPTIRYVSTGSNTAASGAGPGDGVTSGSALTGSDATIINNGSAVAGRRIQVPNTDLTNVLTDGTHAIFINDTTSTHRTLASIEGKGNSGASNAYVDVLEAVGTATLTASTGANDATGRVYAIGGLRLHGEFTATAATVDAAQGKAGWTFWFTGTSTYDQALTWVMVAGNATAGGVAIRGDSASSRATLRMTANARHIDPADGTLLEWLIATTNNGTNTSTAFISNGVNNARGVKVKGCKISTLNQGIAILSAGQGIVENCEIASCKSSGIFVSGSTTGIVARGNYIHDNNTGDNASVGGITLNGSGNSPGQVVSHNIITGNKKANIISNGAAAPVFVDIYANVIDAPTGTTPDNILLTAVNAGFRMNIIGNLITNPGSGRNNISIPSGAANFVDEDYNAYYANGGTNLLNVTAGSNSVTLSADPYTNAAGANYSLNSTAGGGAACKDVGFPQTLSGSSTNAKVDIGVDQGAGGGVIVVEDD